uniref:Uncharacterized protein n=1 Tax=Aegilops tauschii TaxID=37682 RepID=M8C3E8_AEGTA
MYIILQVINHSSKYTQRRWPGSASAPSGAGHGPASKCVCAPATHAGSFKCRFHRTNAVPRHSASPSSSSGTVAIQ